MVHSKLGGLIAFTDCDMQDIEKDGRLLKEAPQSKWHVVPALRFCGWLQSYWCNGETISSLHWKTSVKRTEPGWASLRRRPWCSSEYSWGHVDELMKLSLFLPAGRVRPAAGRLVTQPVFVQAVMVKLYRRYGFSPFTTCTVCAGGLRLCTTCKRTTRENITMALGLGEGFTRLELREKDNLLG